MHLLVAFCLLAVVRASVAPSGAFPWDPIERIAEVSRLLTTPTSFATLLPGATVGSTAVTAKYDNLTAGAIALAAGAFSIDIHTGIVAVCSSTNLHVYLTAGASLRTETASLTAACVSVDAWRGDIYVLLASGTIVNVIVGTSSVSSTVSFTLPSNLTENINTSASDLLAVRSALVVRPQFKPAAVVGNTSINYIGRFTGNTSAAGALVFFQSADASTTVVTAAATQGSLAHHPADDAACLRTKDIANPHAVVCYEEYTPASANSASTTAPHIVVLVAGLIITLLLQ